MEKTLNNTTADHAQKQVADIKFWGMTDMWKLICKASSESEGWMKSTKAMNAGDGILVQVTTQQGDNIAEAVTFVPGASIREMLGPDNKVISRVIIPANMKTT